MLGVVGMLDTPNILVSNRAFSPLQVGLNLLDLTPKRIGLFRRHAQQRTQEIAASEKTMGNTLRVLVKGR